MTTTGTCAVIGAGALARNLVKRISPCYVERDDVTGSTYFAYRNVKVSVRTPSLEIENELMHLAADYQESVGGERERIPIISCVWNNTDIFRGPKLDVIYICVPPSQVQNVCADIADLVSPDTAIVSFAANVPLRSLKAWLPRSNNSCVIRAMTNLAFSPIVYHSNCCLPKAVIEPFSRYDGDSEIIYRPHCMRRHSDEEMDASTLLVGCGYGLIDWFIRPLLLNTPHTMSRVHALEMLAYTVSAMKEDLLQGNPILGQVACHGGLTERMTEEWDKQGMSIQIRDGSRQALRDMRPARRDYEQ